MRQKSDSDRVDQQLRRLLPLMPQLVMGFKQALGNIPQAMLPAGRLGPRHVAALVTLSMVGPASVSELAGRLDMTLNHASQVVGELDQAGLIDRRSDPSDRRRTIVSVLPESQELVQQVAASGARPLRQFLASLDSGDAERFIDQISQLIIQLAPDATT